MADPVHVRDYAFNRTGGSNVQTVNLAQNAGDFLVMCVYWYNNNSDTATISDGVDTWKKIPGTYQVSTGSGSGLGLSSCMFYKFATTTNAGLSTTITAPAGGGNSFTASHGSAFTHINTIQPIGQVNSAKLNSGGTLPNSGNITTTFAKDVVYGQIYNDSNVGSAGSGFTAANVGFTNYLAQYQLTSSTGTFASTQSGGSSSTWNSAVVEIHGEDFVPLFTLSGNAGVAGASIAYSGGSSGTVTADGSGNFSIPNLTAVNDYFLTPTLSGYFFFPTQMKRTISDADVTNAQFNSIAVPFNLYAQNAYYPAIGAADANPIDPGVWLDATGLDPLQTLNQEILASTVADDVSIFNQDAADVGAYGMIHIVSMVDGAEAGIIILAVDVALSAFYELFVTRSGSNLNLSLQDANVVVATASVPYSTDMTIRVEYVNGVLTGYVNNVSQLSGTSADSTSGKGAIEIRPAAATSDVQVIDFVYGTISFVPPNYTISGNIGDGNGEQVKLSGTQTRFVFADGLGNYSFANCDVGPYTVTPAPNPGNAYTPTSRNVTVSNADVPNVDFTSGPAPPSSSGSDFRFNEDFNF